LLSALAKRTENALHPVKTKSCFDKSVSEGRYVVILISVITFQFSKVNKVRSAHRDLEAPLLDRMVYT